MPPSKEHQSMSEREQFTAFAVCFSVLTTLITAYLIGGLLTVIVLAALTDMVLRRIEFLRDRRDMTATIPLRREK